jgi:hypothetical protein
VKENLRNVSGTGKMGALRKNLSLSLVAMLVLQRKTLRQKQGRRNTYYCSYCFLFYFLKCVMLSLFLSRQYFLIVDAV